MTIILQAPSPDVGFVEYETTGLREIEQEVARRIGPFRLLEVQNPQPGEPPGITSTTIQATVRGLRSTIQLGGYEDMYLLRRGRLVDGTRLPAIIDTSPGPPSPPNPVVYNYSVDDRVRMVRVYRADEGALEVDEPWLYAPGDEEEIELHALDPAQELRPAVLSGLRRCFLVDRLVVSQEQQLGGKTDLTLIAPWLTTRDAVYAVDLPFGAPTVGWEVEPMSGGITLRLGEWSPGSYGVINRRPAPAMTFLADGNNGNGPVVRAGTVNEVWDDEDRFAVPMDYAAAAGHIEAWRNARPRLTLLAQTGMWADQREAAAEFTRVSTVFFDPPRYQVSLPVWPGWWGRDLTNAG